MPRSLDEWLLLREDFGVKDEDRLDIMIREMKDVTDTAYAVHEFCIGHEGIDRKTSFYAALCLEAMAGNVVRHGFLADDKGYMERFKKQHLPYNDLGRINIQKLKLLRRTVTIIIKEETENE